MGAFFAPVSIGAPEIPLGDPFSGTLSVVDRMARGRLRCWERTTANSKQPTAETQGVILSDAARRKPAARADADVPARRATGDQNRTIDEAKALIRKIRGALMRIFRNQLVACTLAVATSSCGENSGLLRETLATVSLAGPGFRVVETDVRVAMQVTHYLCMIPAEGRVHTKLMALLHAKASLQPNQTLVNLGEDRDLRFYLFWCEIDYSLSADVLEFRSAAPSK